MVAVMTTYTVTAERTAKWWVLQAVEAPGAISQVARLDQAEQIKEAIAFVTGEAEDSIDIQVQPALPSEAEEARERAAAYREVAERANTAAAAESRRAARELVSAGMTMRDVGTILGVSFQRAQQLASAEPITIPEGERIELVHAQDDVGEIVAHVYLEPIDLHEEPIYYAHTAPTDIVDRPRGAAAS